LNAVAVKPFLVVTFLDASDVSKHQLQLALIKEAQSSNDLTVDELGQSVELFTTKEAPLKVLADCNRRDHLIEFDTASLATLRAVLWKRFLLVSV
jgi:hypothetical protein